LSTPGNYGAACGLLRGKTNNARGNAERTSCGYAAEKQGLRTRVRWFCSGFVHPLRPTANPTRKPVTTLSSPQTQRGCGERTVPARGGRGNDDNSGSSVRTDGNELHGNLRPVVQL
jgi:hypothetical protein